MHNDYDDVASTSNSRLPANIKDEDIIKILITTDNHIGYAEKDELRARDSLLAFEEALLLAQQNDVDLILLGGDLFHENKPSRDMVNSVIELLRKYCFGDKPCALEFLSDPTVNFKHTRFPHVNYQDPNINISIPVFSIHGNHDDPTGLGNLCALDMLSSAGLLNYFGKSDTLDKVTVSPILLRKGETHLALYGLGCIRDERLHRLFEQKNVNILKPKESSERWFNLFTVHQNRSKHSAKDYIPESFWGNFLDFVLWGHEHECRIDPEFNGHFWVSQPGSSIATSLSEGEAKLKHCALLQVHRKHFSLKKLRLQTVRPFYFEDLTLSETDIKPEAFHDKKVLQYCRERVEALIERAVTEHTGNRNQPKVPLIRLRVDYTGGYEPFNAVQFGQQFVGRVANPKDIVLFTKKRQGKEKREILDMADIEAQISDVSHQTVEELVNEYLEAASSGNGLKMDVLSERGLGLAVRSYVQKDDSDALQLMIEKQIKITIDELSRGGCTKEAEISDSVKRFRERRKEQTEVEDAEFNAVLQESNARAAQSYNPRVELSDQEDHIDISDIEPSNIQVNQTTSGRGRAGRGSRGSRGRAIGKGRSAGRGALREKAAMDEDDDECVANTPRRKKEANSILDAFKRADKTQLATSKRSKLTLITSDSDSDEYLPGKKRV